MIPFRKLRYRLRALFRRDDLEHEMDEELRFHLEMDARERAAEGTPPDEARRRAAVSFGGRERIRAEVREARGWMWLEHLVRDVRQAWRTLRRTPGFTAVAVLTLALGLAVNAMLFNITNDLFFRPLPASDPDRLVIIAARSPVIDFQVPFSYADAEDFRHFVESRDSNAPEMARVFDGLMAYRDINADLTATGLAPERAWFHAVSDNYFAVLGVQPHLGRFFLPGEGCAPGADAIVILTHESWRIRFAADPTIVGRAIKLNGQPFTVVGVAPPGFFGASWGTALSGFVPATMLTRLLENGEFYALKRGNTSVFLMGRLKPGMDLAQAQAAMDVACARVVQDNPGYYLPDTRPIVMRERDSRPTPYVAHYMPRVVGVLSSLALLVLLVAVANVANLLYARAVSRERQLAVCSALGASRFHLFRGLLTESTILALAAGVIGSFASLALTPALLAVLPQPPNAAPAAAVATDWRPFVVTAGVSLLVGIVAGLLPAIKASGIAPLPFLKDSMPSGDSRRHRLRGLLVSGQVAASCVVLICAGLALRSMILLLRSDLGFQVENRVVASFDLGRQNYTADRGREFHSRLLAQVRALPGVESASLATSVPLETGINQLGGITAAGTPFDPHAPPPPVAYILVEDACLKTLGMRLEAGRDFDAHDGFGAPRVVIINRALATQLWPGQDPVGRRISIQSHDEAEVIGVIGPCRYYTLADDSRPLLFDALAQNYRGAVSLIVRTAGPAEPLAGALTDIVRQLDPDLPLFGIRTLHDNLVQSPSGLAPYRAGAILAASQGIIALLLAGSGVFGLISFSVARRTREIGIRMALGAPWVSIIRAVMRESLILCTAGLAIGITLAVFMARGLSGLLFGAGRMDGLIFGAVAVLILTTTLLACWLPARRAARLDPVTALRTE